MKKRIIKEYFRGFAWKNMVEAYKDSTALWPSLYLIIILPYANNLRVGIWIYILGFFPLGFCLLSGSIHFYKPSKLFYLCPMDEKERKDYIVGRLLCNLLIPLMIGVIGSLLLLWMTEIDWLTFFLLLLNISLIALIHCGFNQREIIRDDQGRKKGLLQDSSTLEEGFCTIISLCSSIFLLVVFAANDSTQTYNIVEITVKVILLLFALFIQLPLGISLRKKWKKQLQSAFSWEGRG
ncbi:MAG: hypothetical protein ACI4VG_01880 [Lachnospiraceae bacterium]